MGVLRKHLGPTFRFWMQTEVHVFAFSIGANVLLSLFPFLIVMISLCKYALGWQAAVDAIYFSLRETFPGQWNDWLIRNLNYVVARRGPFQVVSVLVLFFTANGVFEPLEVALNKVWGVKTNRSFLRNQLLSLMMIFACGALILLSLVLTAVSREALAKLSPAAQPLQGLIASLVFRSAAAMVAMLVLFLIYWLLPNTKIRWQSVIPVSILVGIAVEVLHFLTLLFWKQVDEKFYLEYGPFEYAAIIVFWSFLASMLLLGGGEWAARRAAPKLDQVELELHK